jgi:WD40 repeat protein
VTTATGPPVRSQDVPERDVPECPYVGLVPFDEKDAEYFFGREHDSDLIVANLIISRLTLLYAPSGVGKTSVLQAGVLPALHHVDDESYDDPDVPGAAVAYVNTWSDAPLESIAKAVSTAVSHVTGADTMEDAASVPTLSIDWLRKVLRESRVSTIYLILDQFEEYFLYHPMDRGEEGLTAELGRILSTRGLPVHVLLSIREDALAGLDRFEGRVPRLFDNYLRLAHLSRTAAQAAIEGPLNHYNRVVPPDQRMSIEPDLIATLLDQVRTGSVRVAPEDTAPDRFAANGPASDDRGDIETPYLQLVLTRLWDQEKSATGSSCLRQSTLEALGGAQTIVRTHLANVMAGLSPSQVAIAAAVFHHLVTMSGAKIALTAEDLADRSGFSASSVQNVLETLCKGPHRILRPLRLPAVGAAGSTRYEIFHDVMGAAVLDWRRRYVTQQQQEKASRHLIEEREEARAAAQTARRQLRLTLLAVGLTVILLATAVVSALSSYRNAQQRKYLEQAATFLSYNPVESLKPAVEAYHISADTQPRSAVLTAASSPRSQVVAGPAESKPMTVIGMASTPDSRHVVVYDADGNIRIIGDNGTVEREQTVSGLRGTVIPVASTISTPAVSTAAVAPDASRIALITRRGVTVIDTVTGKYININSEMPTVVRWIGSAANGLVLVVSSSGVGTTYSPVTGEQVARFPDVYDALPLADGQHIVTSGRNGKLRVWDAHTGTQIAESPTLNVQALRRYGQAVVSLSFNTKPPSIVVWNWHRPDTIVPIPVGDLNGVRQFVVNEHAQVVITSQDKRVRAYSLTTRSLLGSLPPHAGFVNDLAISPDGQWIITAGADGRVLVWALRHGQSPTGPTYELFGHHGEAAQVSYLRGNRVVMSRGLDGTVRRWELPQVPRFDENSSWVVDMDLSRGGSWLATASQDGRIFIIDPHNVTKPPLATGSTNGPLRLVLFDPTEPHRIVTLGQSARVPVLWSWDGHGKLERLPTKYQPPPLSTFGSLVSLAISPDGKTVAGGDTSGTIYSWDALTGALLRTPFPGIGQPANSVAFDRTGQRLAVADSSGVRLWRLGTAESPMPLAHPGATGVAFDPSGQRLVSTAQDGTVKIWTRNGKLDQELHAHGYLSSRPSFSNDGGLLAVGTADGRVEVWDVDSGVTVMLDRHHGGSVNSVTFLPGDRSRLISASDDTTVAQFSCPACSDPNRVIREAQDWVRTNPD